MSIEREAKLTASPHMRVPELDRLVAGVSVAAIAGRRLDAVYYDTADLDLARWGITLRHRSGDDAPTWTLKLPGERTDAALVRRELDFAGSPEAAPSAARDLVRAFVRSRRLVPVAHLCTDRSPLEARDPTGQRLAEIAVDHVTVYQGRKQTGEFREIEVEVLAPGSLGDRFLAAAIDRLVAAGCRTDPPLPKIVRALGPRALEPPELTDRPLTPHASLGELVQHALTHSVIEMMRRDPGVRLGGDPEDVHRFGVAGRRLRSDLHTFASFLEPGPVQELRDELRWIGSPIGAVRDNDVLAARLRRQTRDLPEPDHAGAHLLLSLLADQADAARAAMLAALRSRRYVSLLDALVRAANDPPIRPAHAEAAARPAAQAAGRPVRRRWRRLAAAVAALDDDPSDPALHNVRVLAKRCRCAVEAVAPVTDRQAADLAAALADVESALGEHQDAAVAEAWLHAALATTPDAAIAAGELILVQQRRQARLRARWPATWTAASAKRLRSWI